MPATHTIYERTADESEKAWKAFSIFLDLGNGRGLSEVASRLSVSRQAIQKLAKKHAWFERAVAYDNAIQNAVTDAVIEECISLTKLENEALQKAYRVYIKELTIKENEQNRKLADPEYEYRISSIKTILESGKSLTDTRVIAEPNENKADDTGDLFKLIKDCRVIDASTSE